MVADWGWASSARSLARMGSSASSAAAGLSMPATSSTETSSHRRLYLSRGEISSVKYISRQAIAAGGCRIGGAQVLGGQNSRLDWRVVPLRRASEWRQPPAAIG